MATAGSAATQPNVPCNFLSRALPLIERGMYVIPLAPQGKNALIRDWPNQASNSRKQVEAWAAEWPDANVGCVGRGFVFLDDDRGDLKERIERETGKTFPATFSVNTSVKGTGLVGKHYYFEGRQHQLLSVPADCPA